MKVFFSGATGVIGRRAVPLLREAGHEVTGVSRSPAQRDALERAGARAVEVSLFNPGALRRAVAGHDVVINLATHIPPSFLRMMLPWEWAENDRVRREGSANLADAASAAGSKRFIQESYAPAYPDRGPAWTDESIALVPAGFSRTILDAERSAERFTSGDRAGVVLRFAAFYGPDATQTVELARFIRRGFAPIPGPPDAYISSVSHDDAASAVLAALGVPAGVYDVADDEPVTHREYVDAFASALGFSSPKLPPTWATRLLGPFGGMLARSIRISNTKLRDASAFRPRFPSVREGFRDVAASLSTAVRPKVTPPPAPVPSRGT